MVVEYNTSIDMTWFDTLNKGRLNGNLVSSAFPKEKDLKFVSSWENSLLGLDDAKVRDLESKELERLMNNLPQLVEEMEGFHLILEGYQFELESKKEIDKLTESLEIGSEHLKRIKADIKECEDLVFRHDEMKKENLSLEEEIIQLKLDIADSLGCEDVCQHELKLARSQLDLLLNEKNKSSQSLKSLKSSSKNFGLVRKPMAKSNLDFSQYRSQRTAEHNKDFSRNYVPTGGNASFGLLRKQPSKSSLDSGSSSKTLEKCFDLNYSTLMQGNAQYSLTRNPPPTKKFDLEKSIHSSQLHKAQPKLSQFGTSRQSNVALNQVGVSASMYSSTPVLNKAQVMNKCFNKSQSLRNQNWTFNANGMRVVSAPSSVSNKMDLRKNFSLSSNSLEEEKVRDGETKKKNYVFDLSMNFHNNNLESEKVQMKGTGRHESKTSLPKNPSFTFLKNFSSNNLYAMG